MKNILSIDFDFFCKEDPLWDWGHSEKLECDNHVWFHRYVNSNFNLVEEIDPDVNADFAPADILTKIKEKGFIIKPNTPVCVADSHLKIVDAIQAMHHEFIPNSWLNIINFDAHHDILYKEPDDEEKNCVDWVYKINCDDWVYKLSLLFGEKVLYHWVYPCWLEQFGKENIEKDWDRAKHLFFTGSNSLSYSSDVFSFAFRDFSYKNMLQEIGSHFQVLNEISINNKIDMIFVCRSSPWVPPHCDAHFNYMLRKLGVHKKDLLPPRFGDFFPEEAIKELRKKYKGGLKSLCEEFED
ncbi:MAG: hypothetical protein GF317_04715 [Candidatus Lokiarchaeota archaeon]|nr:hypothetical protein [Candidatus Lokiarchaeota archaeon]